MWILFLFFKKCFLLFQIKGYFPQILSTLLHHDRHHKRGVEGCRVKIIIPESEKSFKGQKGRTRTVKVDRQLDTSIVKVEERSRFVLKPCSDTGRYTSHGCNKNFCVTLHPSQVICSCKKHIFF